MTLSRSNSGITQVEQHDTKFLGTHAGSTPRRFGPSIRNFRYFRFDPEHSIRRPVLFTVLTEKEIENDKSEDFRCGLSLDGSRSDPRIGATRWWTWCGTLRGRWSTLRGRPLPWWRARR